MAMAFAKKTNVSVVVELQVLLTLLVWNETKMADFGARTWHFVVFLISLIQWSFELVMLISCADGDQLSVTLLWLQVRLPPEVNRILYVKNLPYKITAEDMYDIFGKYGAIRQIRV